jgi:uncharacterized protein YdcH (DUF465 family)
MKYFLIIIASSLITWFISNKIDKQKVVEVIGKEIHKEDSVLAKINSTHAKLNEAIYAGDKKVTSTIQKAAETIITLKQEVNTLENKVKVLTNENSNFKKIINAFSNDSSSKFELLPISKSNK